MERITYTPAWLLPEKEEDHSKAPRFFIRLTSILERDQFDAELEGTFRAAEIAAFQLRDVAIEGLNALLGEEDAAEIVQLVHSDYAGEQLDPKEAAKLKAAVDALSESWPSYRAAREQEARRNRILPTLAFVRWCDGWENLSDKDDNEIEYCREKNGIPDAVLRRVPPLILRSVGVEAYRQQYGQGQAGN